MSLVETLPSRIKEQIHTIPIYAAQANVDEKGNFGEQWLIITRESILVFTSEGTLIQELPMSIIDEARIEPVIGGGYLTVDTKEGPMILLRYAASMTGKFSIAAKTIESLIKEEALPVLTEKDLPRKCPKCHRPLQEGTNVCQVCLDKKKVIGRLLGYAKPYRMLMGTAAFLMIVVTLLNLAPPYITKIIVDNVLQPKDMSHTLLWLVILLGATMLILALTQTIRGYIGVWVGSKIMGDLRRDIYNALMRLSLSFFDRRQTSQFIGRVNGDAEAIRQFLTDGVIWIFGQFLMLIAIIGMMLSLNWKLALMTLIPTPLIVFTSFKIWPFVRTRWYKQWRAITRLNMIVGDSLQGIRVVKAFGQEAQERNRYYRGNKELVGQTIQFDGMWQGIFPLFSFLTSAGSLLVWYFGGWFVLRNEMSLGTLMALIAYLGMFFGPLQWFSQALNWMTNALSAADRIFEIMDAPLEVPDVPNAKKVNGIVGRVVLDNVSFGYDRYDPVLKNINLEVEQGEMIGLVGHSGAGKSTLINLICRFYDPTNGKITVDEIDLRDLSQEDLHKQIGVVLQETFLFDGTISENIAYSKPDATTEEIMRAAKIANAHDFIVEMADGYDTKVGERGQRLSGGQKQRIAIARAILHDPRILILDEATASVDTETERKIQEAISRLVKGRTTFAIAHRLSTLRNANRLVVIDHGKIAEIGTHDELMSQEGIYHKLVDAQRELSKIKGVEVG